jgi:FkbM family methyltransferase
MHVKDHFQATFSRNFKFLLQAKAVQIHPLLALLVPCLFLALYYNQITYQSHIEMRLIELERQISQMQRENALSPQTQIQQTAVMFNGDDEAIKVPVNTLTITRKWAEDLIAKRFSAKDLLRIQSFYSGLRLPKQMIPAIEFEENDIVFDIGANLGKFTEYIRAQCQDKCKIIAFECMPEYSAYIQAKMVHPQHDDKTFVIAKGLSDVSNKNARIFMDPTNFGWNSIIVEKVERNMIERYVELVRLDDLDLSSLVNLKKVRLIKIDTEGAEALVIKGARQFLKSLFPRPILLIEIAWGKDEHPMWDKVIIEFEWLFSNGWKRIDLNEMHDTQDVVLFPN